MVQVAPNCGKLLHRGTVSGGGGIHKALTWVNYSYIDTRTTLLIVFIVISSSLLTILHCSLLFAIAIAVNSKTGILSDFVCR